ncbi:Glycoside hydrolase family 128 protein [Pyrenophora tritici-repentis]|nr:Glycoside hydrolase family 128 protein [Pyrenophora tritici-repentis]
MSSVKITSLLALASVAAAVPHYQHNKFHHRAAYPTGGWGAYNSSAVPAGTGTTTIDTTSTSTQTLYSTVYLHASSSPESVDAAAASTGLFSTGCGANTVTVTAKEKVTVTITPGAGTPAPKPSAPAAESSESPIPSSAPVKTPVAETTSAAGYPAQTPEASPVVTTSMAQQPVASSAAPSSSLAPSPSAGNGYSGIKRGLAYNDAHLCSTFGAKFGFGYNWGQAETNDIGTQFIPMMHGPDKSTAQEWLANVDLAVKKHKSTAVMGFNEPDIAAQANLSPEAACSAWKEYMNPIKSTYPEITIIGPSVSNGQAPLGLDWLSRFHTVCPDAIVDAANIHFYDQYDSTVFDRFKAHVEKAAKQTGQKLFITEFGLNPGTANPQQAAEFLAQCIEYLDAEPVVDGYAYFMVGEGENQLNSNGALSAAGKIYAGTA